MPWVRAMAIREGKRGPASMSVTEKLRTGWDGLLQRLDVDPAGNTTWFARLVEAYSGPERFYHNLEHVRHVLKVIGSQRPDVGASTVLELAAWFHDSVYDPRARD